MLQGMRIMGKMIFTTDRTSLAEGEVIEVRWDCTGAESVRLCIDNGYRSTELALETSGSKRFRLNRSKGKTLITIKAVVDGKEYTKTIKVKVTDIPVSRAEAVDEKGRKLGSVGEWWRQRVLPKWHSAKARWHGGRNAMGGEKKLAARILIILAVAMLLSPLMPVLLPLGLIVVVCYLAWVLLKR